MAIKRVWIDEGCISCNLCEDLVPEVFEVRAGETCRTRKRYERVLDEADMDERLDEASESCPVEVIRLEKP